MGVVTGSVGAAEMVKLGAGILDLTAGEMGTRGSAETRAAEAALIGREPQRALAWCEQGLAIDPHHQSCLAMMSIAMRMLDDEREEALSGYDKLVAVMDLDIPRGFSSMEAFNAELKRLGMIPVDPKCAKAEGCSFVP